MGDHVSCGCGQTSDLTLRAQFDGVIAVCTDYPGRLSSTDVLVCSLAFESNSCFGKATFEEQTRLLCRLNLANCSPLDHSAVLKISIQREEKTFDLASVSDL